MTVTDRSTIGTELPGAVAVDLYRDIHKGIRAELFAATLQAGSLDPVDRAARAALADRVGRLVDLLDDHAAHEDGHVQPALTGQLPDLAERIAADHERLEAQIHAAGRLAAEVPGVTGADARAAVHGLYLDLADFTGTYLLHQETEEREVMPALKAAIGPEATFAIHQAIVTSIPPEKMAQSLALMLPAMNVDDRTELLGGMQAGAPPEVFAGVWGLAASVLAPADVAALGGRLGIDA